MRGETLSPAEARVSEGQPSLIDRSNRLWYKDAIIYQVHVKSFFDANDDGMGDFEGLIQKLDYIQALGVTAIWVMPFYPSPLRDDGYDIADYRQINPSYGTLGNFRRFIKEAHRRGLRVIIELVINHTSDQHPWFQRARRAKAGSNYRNFYVWNDTDQKYLDTRIIFLDTETSNWAWDPVAQAYYWHRFYSHQPDLNFENPHVLRAILNVLHFWLQMGVDGLRLDAVPYLREREGTNNENLPETHEILKKIRQEVDAHYPDRMLLAEANQWPEDVQEYFGDADECHMAFHFPLMPRMYMAIAQEDRHPITDIMRQTPEIPETCQWAIFLRNHDELTLEMVTDQERDYLWNFYAGDRRMRINLGIRRRLAPLMEYDRRKIELMNCLLLSMPGTPVIYYGDEIGMGDNIYLGDRDGVRTPMQWSPDRNGGFSRADPARLFLPPIMDPIYGYDAVNAEAQQRAPSSLLNWMKRIIAVRQSRRAFGRGQLNFLYPGNRKVLAYLREYEGDCVLCVANLSRSAQAVELDLSRFRGKVPVELLGRTPFPPIGDLPYLLTLSSYGFYWFVLTDEAELPRWHEPIPEPLPEFVTLIMRPGWRSITLGREGSHLVQQVLPSYLPKQRWFAAKDKRIESTHLAETTELSSATGSYLLAVLDVHLAGEAEPQRYLLPLTVSWEPNAAGSGSPILPFTLAKTRRGPQVGAIYDAVADNAFSLAMIEAMRAGQELATETGKLRFTATARLAEVEIPEGVEVRRLGVEQSNSSAMIDNLAILKLYRRLITGPHPELEIGRFLTEVADYRHTPPLLGTVEHVTEDGATTALALLQGYVQNQGDGWVYTLNYLERVLEDPQLLETAGAESPLEEFFGLYLAQARLLGQRTGELHQALAIPTENPAFAAEPITPGDLTRWRLAIRHQAERAFTALEGAATSLAEHFAEDAAILLRRRAECLARIDALTEGTVRATKTRLHGDFHLGQVLVVKDDFYILDFEGEPARPLAERRAKSSPLKDVAGMLRSFDYAAWSAVSGLSTQNPDLAATLLPHAVGWRDATTRCFLEGYAEAMQGCASWPEDAAEQQRLIDLFRLEKALYEICYEAANRPNWVGIPVRGVLGILDAEPGSGES